MDESVSIHWHELNKLGPESKEQLRSVFLFLESTIVIWYIGNTHVKSSKFQVEPFVLVDFLSNLSFSTLDILWFFILIYTYAPTILCGATLCHSLLLSFMVHAMQDLYTVFVQENKLTLPITSFQDNLGINNNAWGIYMRLCTWIDSQNMDKRIYKNALDQCVESISRILIVSCLAVHNAIDSYYP